MALPSLPSQGQDPWYETRTTWDNAVKAELEGRLSEAELNATIARRQVPVFPITEFGEVDVFGITDSSEAINAAISAAYASGGGIILFPSGHIKWGISPQLPNSAATETSNVGYQPTLRFEGTGAVRGSLWGTGMVVKTPGSETVLEMGATTGLAQIDTRGTGELQIRNLTFYDPNPAPLLPFIQTTNTLLLMDNVSFFGSPDTIEAACVKDAIVLGGTGHTHESNSPESIFQGYGTHLSNLYFSNIRRGVKARNAVNSTYISNPVFSLSCGGVEEAAIEFNGPSLDTVANLVVNPVIEMRGYKYGVILGPHGKNTFVNPGFWDPIEYTEYCFYMMGGSDANTVLGGHFQTPTERIYGGDGHASNNISLHYGTTIAGTVLRVSTPNTLIQPHEALPGDGSFVFEVKRSPREASSPAATLLRLANNGNLSLIGPSPTLAAGTTSVGNSGVVKSSGNLDLFAGSEANTVAAARGFFRMRARTSALRPEASLGAGTYFFDSTLKKILVSDGTAWYDAMGNLAT